MCLSYGLYSLCRAPYDIRDAPGAFYHRQYQCLSRRRLRTLTNFNFKTIKPALEAAHYIGEPRYLIGTSMYLDPESALLSQPLENFLSESGFRLLSHLI